MDVIGAVGSQGLANCIASGNTVVSALFAGQVGTASLTVTNATLTSISVTPASPSISLGSSQQFTAVGTFSDGSTLNISGQANRTSSSQSSTRTGWLEAPEVERRPSQPH